ncbi:MAG TPA: VOC family protein [Dokdonella sp.]|jgi:catechol 2,3-dioxygenase-like lactoylglutathione lyase family enzyme|nr:VOC family protein [Dokdonella sp.]
MPQQFHAMSLLVRDYDEAIHWYTEVLGFDLLEDTPRGPDKRWVRIAPRGSAGACLLLARAGNAGQATYVGNQTGGRVFLFLHTDDFAGDYARLLAHGVRFCEEPRQEEYGTVVVFEDLYGNRWDLIEPKS